MAKDLFFGLEITEAYLYLHGIDHLTQHFSFFYFPFFLKKKKVAHAGFAIRFVSQADLEVSSPPASIFQVLGLYSHESPHWLIYLY